MQHPSQELRSPEAFATRIHDVLDHTLTRFGEQATAKSLVPVEFSGLDVYSFTQTWSDASRGFGGIAAQVLPDTQTVVVSCSDGATAAVDIRGKLPTLWTRRISPSGAASRSIVFRGRQSITINLTVLQKL
jgi:hypothetical protein